MSKKYSINKPINIPLIIEEPKEVVSLPPGPAQQEEGPIAKEEMTSAPPMETAPAKAKIGGHAAACLCPRP